MKVPREVDRLAVAGGLPDATVCPWMPSKVLPSGDGVVAESAQVERESDPVDLHGGARRRRSDTLTEQVTIAGWETPRSSWVGSMSKIGESV
jgi:hypothetical protein